MRRSLLIVAGLGIFGAGMAAGRLATPENHGVDLAASLPAPKVTTSTTVSEPSTTTTLTTTTTVAGTTMTAETSPPGHELTLEYLIMDHGDPAGVACTNGSADESVSVIGSEGNQLAVISFPLYGTTISTPADIPNYTPVLCKIAGSGWVADDTNYTLSSYLDGPNDGTDRATYAQLEGVGWVWTITRGDYSIVG